MVSLKRIFLILMAFVAGNFLAVNALLAGRALSDFSNLQYYSQWEGLGGPLTGYLLHVLLGTLVGCCMALIPTIFVLILTETLRIRSIWFYALAGGLGAFLFDIACTMFDIVQVRSFCVRISFSEVAIVSVAGVVAGYVFWRIAGNRSGEWSARMPLAPSSSG
jgi:hypothetical protein